MLKRKKERHSLRNKRKGTSKDKKAFNKAFDVTKNKKGVIKQYKIGRKKNRNEKLWDE